MGHFSQDNILSYVYAFALLSDFKTIRYHSTDVTEFHFLFSIHKFISSIYFGQGIHLELSY